MIGFVAAVLIGGIAEDAAALALDGRGQGALKLLASAKADDAAARFVEACVLIDRGDFTAALDAIGRLEAIRPDAFEAVVLRRLIIRRRDMSIERWTSSAIFAWHDGPRGRPAPPLLVLRELRAPAGFWSFGWPIRSLHADHFARVTATSAEYRKQMARVPVLAIVDVETSAGARVDARLRARDGGELWSATRSADDPHPRLAGWVPSARGNLLTVSQTYPDGGTCVAAGPLHTDQDTFAIVLVERRPNGSCRLVDPPPMPGSVGDFRPHPAPSAAGFWFQPPVSEKIGGFSRLRGVESKTR